MSVSVVVKNAASTTGEGPHWDERNNCLLHVDIVAGDVHKWDAATNSDTKRHFDKTVSFVVPQKSGGYLIGLGQTITHLDWDTGKTKVICEVEEGKQTRFNDAKCDPRGRLWAGTMGLEPKPAEPIRKQGSLYCLHPDGTMKSHVSGIDISNGLAWSSDHKTMYYIDSLPREIYAFDYDIEAAEISNRRVCINFGEKSMEERGFPDGMCIDTDDNIWVACYKAGKVIKFNPKTGEELDAVHFPAKRITSCCFGGPNMDVLYVTCGRFGLSDEEFEKEQPLAGSVFKVTGLGVKGLPAPIFDA